MSATYRRTGALFQFTPLREGRPDGNEAGAACVISIHAPPRGATLYLEISALAPSISIHAPPRGATMLGFPDSPAILFQFTPLREGRLALNVLSVLVQQFQFTPLREGRHSTAAAEMVAANFNSRPSARGDAQLHGSWFSISFQFTPLREGRRARRFGNSGEKHISIHAPPRGAT